MASENSVKKSPSFEANLTPDPERYAKLLQEYTKLKKNNGILKKAVLDEQSKSSALEDQLKVHDEKIRMMMEEHDMLTFNNDRLTKRVESLQEQLLERQQKAKDSSWFGGGKKILAEKEEKLEVVGDELERRIQENAQLYLQMGDLKKEKEEAVQLMQAKLETLKVQLQEKQEEAEREVKRAETSRVFWEKENKRLVTEVDSLRATVEQLQKEKAVASKLAKETNDKLSSELAAAKVVIRNKIVFDDTQFPSLNQLNLPEFESGTVVDHGPQAVNALGVFKKLLSCFEQHSEAEKERLDQTNKGPIASDALKTVNRKIMSLLPEQSRLLSCVSDPLSQFVTAVLAKQPASQDSKKLLVESLTQFVAFHKNVLSCHLLRLDEESKQKYVPQVVQSHNTNLSDKEFQLQVHLEGLVSVTKKLVDGSAKSPKALESDLKELQHAFLKIASSLDSIAKETALKFAQEEKGTYAPPTQKQVNQKFLDTLQEIQSQTLALSTSVEDYLRELSSPMSVPIRGVICQKSSDLSKLDSMRLRASKYLSLVNGQPPRETISYEESLSNKASLARLEIEKQQVLDRLAQANQQIEQLTGEKDKLSAELMTARDIAAGKDSKITDLLAKLAAARENPQQKFDQQLVKDDSVTPDEASANLIHFDEETKVPQSPQIDLMDALMQTPRAPTDSPDVKTNGRYKMRVLDENGTQSKSLQFSSEDKEREAEMRKHYETKINNVATQFYLADTKAKRLSVQYEKAKEDLKKLTEERDALQKELEVVQLSAKNLRDEVETTRKSYEEQMNVLTEFITSQNEKISGQTEALNAIKRSKVLCGKCKKWNTIEWLTEEGQNGRKCSGGNHGSYYNFA